MLCDLWSRWSNNTLFFKLKSNENPQLCIKSTIVDFYPQLLILSTIVDFQLSFLWIHDCGLFKIHNCGFNQELWIKIHNYWFYTQLWIFTVNSLWLESYRSEESHGKKLDIFGVTIWLTEFVQHFGSEMITPADTLSYVGHRNTLTSLHTTVQTCGKATGEQISQISE